MDMANSSPPYLDREIKTAKTFFTGSHCGSMIQQCRENATYQPTRLTAQSQPLAPPHSTLRHPAVSSPAPAASTGSTHVTLLHVGVQTYYQGLGAAIKCQVNLELHSSSIHLLVF